MITVRANVDNGVSFEGRTDDKIYFIAVDGNGELISADWESGQASQVDKFLGKTVYPLTAENYVFTGTTETKHPVKVSNTSTGNATYYIPVATETVGASNGWLEVKRLTKDGTTTIKDNPDGE